MFNRIFLFALAVGLVLAVLVAGGLAIFTPAPAPHHVQTVLPNDRFTNAH